MNETHLEIPPFKSKNDSMQSARTEERGWCIGERYHIRVIACAEGQVTSVQRSQRHNTWYRINHTISNT